MNKSFEAMAQRAENAMNQFVENIMDLGGMDREEADKVAKFYLDNKLAKIDYGIGSVRVSHGAYWDADVLARAAMMADQS